MSYDKTGKIQAKPIDRNDAISKIRAAREGSFLCTGFCLDKKVWQGGSWNIIERIADVISAEFIYYVPEHWLDYYLNNTPFLAVSGAIAVEKFGNQFLKRVHGSYSTIIGLPIFEVRQGLEKLGFFD
jgi:predicted house-cleaning NTP pyrophosphatase (Maf/HAM1 superfamily)